MPVSGILMGTRAYRVRHDWATSLSLFTFMHWRRKWQPTPYSCLENPRDKGAWWAAIYGVAQSRTLLKWLSSSSCLCERKALNFKSTSAWVCAEEIPVVSQYLFPSSLPVKIPIICFLFFSGRQDIVMFYLLAVLDLCCCVSFSLVVVSRGYSPVAMCRLLIEAASLVVEHRL